VIALVLLAIPVWTTTRSQSPSLPAKSAVARPAVVSGVVGIDLDVEGNGSGYHPQPYARIVVTGNPAAGTPVVRRFTADGLGRFKLALPPGRYTVTAIVVGPATTPLSWQPHTRVTVIRGHPVNIRLTGKT
jgi:hypothetical protein